MKKYILLFLLALTTTFVNAQSNLEKADTAFRYKEYSKAIEYYNKVLKKDQGNTDAARIYFQIGECYRYENKYKESEKWYE